MIYTVENLNDCQKGLTGIYKISNIINGKVYVGQSLDIKNRWKGHIGAINHDNCLYRAFRKYGIENFTFEILELCDKKLLNEREIFWIASLQSNKSMYGYNMTPGGSYQVALESPIRKPVRAYLLDDENNIIDKGRDFVSCNEAARQLEQEFGLYYYGSTIGMICNGKSFKMGKHTFCFIDKDGNDIPTGYVNHYTKELVFISPQNERYYFKSLIELAKFTNMERGGLRAVLKQIDHRIQRGKYQDYRIYLQSEEPLFEDLTSEKLLQDFMTKPTEYDQIYRWTSPDNKIEYYTTINEISRKYGIHKTVCYRNMDKNISKGAFKGWKIEKITNSNEGS